jgi:gliding motility-associated lipoprotein GldB
MVYAKVRIFSVIKKPFFLCLFMLCGLLLSCNPNKLEVNVSTIKLSIKIKRFEQDLFRLKQQDIAAGIPALEKKYGNFLQRFSASVIKIGTLDNPSYAANLKGFLMDNDINSVYSDVQAAYSNVDQLNEDLTDAFKHYRYHFPTRTIPQVVTFVSGFNYALVADDSTLGIGLDMYMGEKYKYYELIQYPKYRTHLMDREHIAVDAIRSWVSSEFDDVNLKPDMLSQILFQGKVMYALDACFPAEHDTLKIGYSKKQNDWVKGNEAKIWAYFIDKKLLFSTNYGENLKYINDAPFTSGLPRESPPKVGVWLGWQIIRAYMNNNKTSLEELFAEKDAQKILNRSKYKPAK